MTVRLTIVWNVTPCSLKDTSTYVSEELTASSISVGEFGTSVEGYTMSHPTFYTTSATVPNGVK